MNLILSNQYLDVEERINVCLANGFSPCYVNLDGLSFKEVKDSLTNYKNIFIDKANDKYLEIGNFETIISSDERLLLLQNTIFDLENIYLYDGSMLIKLTDCISKELRPAHNLFKMYLADAFSLGCMSM